MRRRHAIAIVLAGAGASGAVTPVLALAPLAVEIVTVTPISDARTLSLTGEIAARTTLSASFPASGRIVAMLAHAGDKVKAGAVLARIDAVQQDEALRSAEAALVTAKANATKAEDDANRQDGLLQRGATTRSARDAAFDALRAAQAQVAQAEADVDRAKKAVSDTVLTAPSDATVTQKLGDVGQVVGAAQPVLQLAIGNRYDAVFEVPEQLLTNLPEGPVTVKLSPVDRPSEFVMGTPRQVSPLVDPTQGTVKVKVAMAELPPGLRFGDAIVGTIHSTGQDRIALPWPAMTATAQGPAVWVVDPATHRVSLRQVTVLRYETGRIVLASGVKAGEEVVGLGASLLFPGRVVRQAEGK